MITRHEQFWKNHPRLMERWNVRHPNHPINLAGLDSGSNTGMWIGAAVALALFFTPLGKRLMKAFRGD